MEHPFSQLEVIIEKINYLFGQMKNDASNNSLGNKVELSLLKKYGTTLYDRIIELEKVASGEMAATDTVDLSNKSMSAQAPTNVLAEPEEDDGQESKKILYAEPGSRIMRRVKKINKLSGEHIEIHDDDIIEEGTINEYVPPKNNILTTETILLPNSKLNDKIVEAEEPVEEALIQEAKSPIDADNKVEVVKEEPKAKKKSNSKTKAKSKKKKAAVENFESKQQGLKDFSPTNALTFEINLDQEVTDKTATEKMPPAKAAGVDQIIQSLSSNVEPAAPEDMQVLPKSALKESIADKQESTDKLLDDILNKEAKTEVAPKEESKQDSKPKTEEKAEKKEETDPALKTSEAVVAPKEEKEIIKVPKGNFFQIDNNQKIRFTKELFNGDANAYQETIAAMSGCSNVIEAYTYVNLNVKGKYNWDSEKDTVKEFQKIVKDKFLG